MNGTIREYVVPIICSVLVGFAGVKTTIAVSSSQIENNNEAIQKATEQLRILNRKLEEATKELEARLRTHTELNSHPVTAVILKHHRRELDKFEKILKEAVENSNKSR